MPKRVIGNTPFMLVYEREKRIPISLEFPSLKLAHQLELIEHITMIITMTELMELEEKRHQAIETLDAYQQKAKRSFDKKDIAKVFKEGYLILKWDADRGKEGRHSKFNALWSGPYIITSCKGSNAFQLSRRTGEVLLILVNGIHLKLCF